MQRGRVTDSKVGWHAFFLILATLKSIESMMIFLPWLNKDGQNDRLLTVFIREAGVSPAGLTIATFCCFRDFPCEAFNNKVARAFFGKQALPARNGDAVGLLNADVAQGIESVVDRKFAVTSVLLPVLTSITLTALLCLIDTGVVSDSAIAKQYRDLVLFSALSNVLGALGLLGVRGFALAHCCR